MKPLYQLPRGCYFKLDNSSFILKLHHLDGAYSYCSDLQGNIHHIAGYAPVYQLSPDEVAVYVGEQNEA